MTAEIAILNKSAVALAADSAVTIGTPPTAKIYNTVNKIFELSEGAPVGVMIYGRLDFMGLPLEVIVKEYRKALGQNTFPHVEGYRDSFRDYLRNNVPFNDRDANLNVYITLYASFTRAWGEIDRLITADMQSRGAFQVSRLNGILLGYLREQTEKLKQSSFSPGFRKVGLPAKYNALVDELTSRCFAGALPKANGKAAARRWAGYLLAKEALSQSRSGVVVAGFGSDEWCPTLAGFEMDGILDGRLKYQDMPTIDIGRQTKEADILGFAQDDMVKSFLEGVDPTIKNYLLGLVEEAIGDVAAATAAALLNDKAQEATALAALQPALTQMKTQAKDKAAKYIDDKGSAPIRDMVSAMPKQELARLAESLIEITSLKRKVTRTQETVGGDVDVAVISKSEGFVWTKRKHYFPSDLNPRFFARHFH